MFFKPFELRGHRQCPHKTPSNCNTSVIPMLLNKFCPRKPQKPVHTHTHTTTHTYTHTHLVWWIEGHVQTITTWPDDDHNTEHGQKICVTTVEWHYGTTSVTSLQLHDMIHLKAEYGYATFIISSTDEDSKSKCYEVATLIYLTD